MLRQLRQPRYLGLGAFMVVIAAVCALAGTWQIQRLAEKHSANVLLRRNAETAVAPVGRVLPTMTVSAATTAAQPSRPLTTAANFGKFRPVAATGTYDAHAQLLVREQTVEGTVGYLVLTPLRTAEGADLLVVRGFVAAGGAQAPAVSGPTTATVSIVGRVQPAQTQDDRLVSSPAGQIRTINLSQAAGRLNSAVYAGYVELLAGQPGTEGLTAIPSPDLSNAAGGAIEPQHVAYIIQWYLFALVALAAPLMMARADLRRLADEDPSTAADPWTAFDSTKTSAPAPASPQDQAQAAKLTARYGSSRKM